MLDYLNLPANTGSYIRRQSGQIIMVALLLALAAPLNAQVLEEVVVTAQKREQDIQDVGIAVSAFTGDQMRALDVNDSFDIAAWVPNVHISGNIAGQNTQFSIRGVTQNDFNDIIEAPVAVYLDEGYIPVAQAQTFALFDIERVEVLKGPQSTLFGRNATGGVVQYISRKPSFDGPEAYVDATYGQYDTSNDANRFKLEAAVGGPFSDTVAGRIAFLYNDREPYLENVYRGDDALAERFGAGTVTGGGNGFAANAPGSDAGADLGDNETTALRGILQFNPQDTLRFTLSGNWEDTDMATGPYQSKPTIAVYDGDFAGLNPTPPIPGVDPGGRLSQGELLNVIDVAASESRLSICAPGGVDNGEDCGADQNNDGAPDDLAPMDGNVDQGRVNNQFQLTPGGDFFGYNDPDGEDWTFSGDFAFEDQGSTETFGVALRVEWDLSDSMTLTSITDFKDYEKLVFIDVDSAPVNQSANYAGVDADSTTQEIRVNGTTDKSSWVAGFYYLNIDTDSDNGLKFPVNSTVSLGGPLPGILPPGPFDLGVDAQLKTDSYSLFGQVDWELVDNWTLIVGARVVQEEKDYHFEQNVYYNSDSRTVNQSSSDAPIPGPIIIGPVGSSPADFAPFDDSSSDTLWAGKLQVDWRPNDDWLLYAGLNRGVKAGSFNAQLAGGLPIAPADIPYGDETLHSIETGFKSTWADGRTRFNGTFFYYDYSDYQAFLFTGVGGVVINADAETIGAELELQTTPIDNLDILLSLGWFDAEVQDVPSRTAVPGEAATCTSSSPVSCRDVDPVYAPEVQASGLIRYAWPAFGGMMSIQGDASYSDSFFYNLRNFDADQFDSYTLVNAALGWTSPEEHWDVNLAVRNLTDEHAGIQGFNIGTVCGCNEISFRAPRQYVVQLRYSY
jgi:iron complex outermembrane receptor protein